MLLYPFEIHTPRRKFYGDSVEAIIVRLIDGDIGVYANHAFFTAPICACVLKIKEKNGEWKSAYISEGILEVKGHKTVLLVDAAEWPEEIDYERALAQKKTAEAQMQENNFKIEINKAKIRLARAAAQIEASETMRRNKPSA
jgi:F-type H+-transporting ATPase subunit epsilon